MKDRLMAWMALNGPALGAAALFVVAVVVLTGCSTVAGLGKDVTSAAEWTKDKMGGDKK